MTDNVIQFPEAKTYEVDLFSPSSEVEEVLHSLCIAMRGMVSLDDINWGHCVEACLLAIVIAASEDGWPIERVQALFDSVKMAPATDV